jgi:glutathione peroxidase-family protein
VNYGVTFPVLGKIDVNGANADPSWEWMKKEKPGLLGMKMNAGYCEGELCCIESAVGTEYIGE